MYQGSIGLFVNTITNDKIWLWKVRDKNGIFYYDVYARSVIPSSDVEDTMGKITAKRYRIVHELPADVAMRSIRFRQPDIEKAIEDAVKEKSLYDMAAEIEAAQKEITRLTGIIDQAAETERNAMAQRDNLNYDLEKLQYQLEAAKKQTDGYLFTYVYGKHSAENTVEYCWYADPTLAKQVKIGDTISVNTSRGQQLAIVTRIEKSNQYRNHKRVLDVVHSANCFEDDLPY